MKNLVLPAQLTPKQAHKLKGKFLTDQSFNTLIEEDCDAYDTQGKLLFKFRKAVIPNDMLLLGYQSFKDSVELTTGRGVAAGGYTNVIKKDGTKSNFDTSPAVNSGIVGYMDARPGSGTNAVCRKTAFLRSYFEKYASGVPFVQWVDKLYSQLCPEHHARQLAIAKGTNRNYRIGDTAFTTVTVNKNFQTAVHKDAGDYPEGFGNLCIYRQGNWSGAYFCLPEYKVAVNMHNTDILFVDVHRWHGNTPFVNMQPEDLRIAFVMYYREYMYKCKSPVQELARIKQEQTGWSRL